MTNTFTKHFENTLNGIQKLRRNQKDLASDKFLEGIRQDVKQSFAASPYDVDVRIRPALQADHGLTDFNIEITLPDDVNVSQAMLKQFTKYVNGDFEKRWRTKQNRLMFQNKSKWLPAQKTLEAQTEFQIKNQEFING